MDTRTGRAQPRSWRSSASGGPFGMSSPSLSVDHMLLNRTFRPRAFPGVLGLPQIGSPIRIAKDLRPAEVDDHPGVVACPSLRRPGDVTRRQCIGASERRRQERGTWQEVSPRERHLQRLWSRNQAVDVPRDRTGWRHDQGEAIASRGKVDLAVA
jgi:hypothetical protein